MDQERWARINEIFHQACERAPAERDAFLRSMCAGDTELHDAVRTLLDQDARAEGALAGVVLGALDRLPVQFGPGSRVGPYRIVRELGRGGMGAVYLAERADEQFEQRVALKLIKPGLDTEQILKRFRAERQILARLQHANIARLLDGGVTEEGNPFFAMEHVDGVRIDDYCAAHGLGVDERLALFRAVCGAVMYAHTQLIVHGDLKPANMLVGADGQVRLLDFGLARVLTEEPGSEQTQAGFRALTPAYASPEQVRGERVGTATDVYALGVILYELLAGVRPYELDSASAQDVERIVCTTQPEPPSARATAVTTSADGGAAALRLRRRLKGDLDVICLKALRKEPERRYGSVEAMLADIERHQRGFPVLARPDSAGYRVGRFVSRHRTGMGVGVAILIAVSGLVGFYTWRLAGERDRARLEATRAEQVSQFLKELFAVSDPRESGGETITARELLDKGADRLDTELVDQPEIRASMMRLIGDVYAGLGLNTRARTLLERALAEHRRLHGPVHAEVATSEVMLAVVLDNQDDLEAADSLFAHALVTRERLLGPDHADVLEVLHHVTNLRAQQGRLDEAVAIGRRVLDLEKRQVPADERRVANAAVRLGGLLRDDGQLDEAEQLLRDGLERQRVLYGDTSLRVASTARNLGALLRRRGSLDAAEPLLREALDIRRKMLGELHPDFIVALSTLGGLMGDRGNVTGAIAALAEVIELETRSAGKPTSNLAVYHYNLGNVLRDDGRADQAVSHYTESMRVQDAVLPAGHPNRAMPRMALAGVHSGRAPLRRCGAAVARVG